MIISDVENTQLRNYQILGLNWMIKMYENGMNGILADGKQQNYFFVSKHNNNNRNGTWKNFTISLKK